MAQSKQLGKGGRFAELKQKLARRGARNPAALAAWIGRQKYGTERMAAWAAAERRRGRGRPPR
ncbi:MAG: hypothetical protein QN130_12450 [Armatimonadota bacterium]|nr:hypothetical protein [Armatimonadota bacterium]